MVSRANQALENIPNIEMDEGLRNRLLGQAYFLRALAYFNLTNVHENVPLILETPKGGDSYYPSNEGVTRDMVYSQVKSDLETAIGLLPLNYNSVEGPDQGQFGRATQGAAQSLLGKVFLFEGNYSEAGRYFEAVINSNEYALGDNYFDLFTQDPGLENSNPGKIFWADFTTSTAAEFNWGGDPNVNWRQFLAITPTYSQGDFYDFYATEFLYNEMREELTSYNALLANSFIDIPDLQDPVIETTDDIIVSRQEDQPVLLLPGLVTTIAQDFLCSGESLIRFAAAVGSVNRKHDQAWASAIVIRHIGGRGEDVDAAKMVILSENTGDSGL